jgi:hypothetical protein
MDTFNYNNFQLIKRDIRTLKHYIIKDNDINDWNKIIIIYNFYLIFNHLYIAYYLIDHISKDNNNNFVVQFGNIYVFFFILCNLRNSYLYCILNISKIDKNLANSLYGNTKEYFVF